jgi:hypothetical protein
VSAGRELQQYQAHAERLTSDIEDTDTEKAQRLAAAKFPVEGLGISDAGGVTWNGLPFEQASTAVRTRVSVAIGFALNPKLKILLVRNGNDLDAKNLQLLADLAKEAGGQVWVERIAGGDRRHPDRRHRGRRRARGDAAGADRGRGSAARRARTRRRR